MKRLLIVTLLGSLAVAQAEQPVALNPEQIFTWLGEQTAYEAQRVACEALRVKFQDQIQERDQIWDKLEAIAHTQLGPRKGLPDPGTIEAATWKRLQARLNVITPSLKSYDLQKSKKEVFERDFSLRVNQAIQTLPEASRALLRAKGIDPFVDIRGISTFQARLHIQTIQSALGTGGGVTPTSPPESPAD